MVSPWLCFGDFNELLNSNEKMGSLDRNAGMVADFRESVKDCKLKDVGCRGHRLTWSNMRFGPHYIDERLDRFMCNQKWRAKFYDCLATNLIH